MLLWLALDWRAGAAATLAELGYDVKCFCYQILPAERILLPHRALMLQKTISTMAIGMAYVLRYLKRRRF